MPKSATKGGVNVQVRHLLHEYFVLIEIPDLEPKVLCCCERSRIPNSKGTRHVLSPSAVSWCSKHTVGPKAVSHCLQSPFPNWTMKEEKRLHLSAKGGWDFNKAAIRMERGVGALRHSAALEQAGLHCRELRMSNFLPNFSHRKSLCLLKNSAQRVCQEISFQGGSLRPATCYSKKTNLHELSIYLLWSQQREGYPWTSGIQKPSFHLEFIPGMQLSLTVIAKLI